MHEIEKFSHRGAEYSVCASETENRVAVMIMKDGERANGFTYIVERELISDALNMPLRSDLVRELARIAIADFCA